MTPLVEMRGIRKSFFGVPVLKEVDFEVFPSEVHVLLGENGAGKSTLIKILSGAYRCDEGALRIGGSDVDPFRYDPREAQRLGISTVYQNFHLIPHLSVAENVSLTAVESPGGLVNWKKMRTYAASVVSDFGLDLDLAAPVNTLSISERQLLEICIAISRNARVLVMDEPTSALSRKEVDTLFLFVDRLRNRQIGIIYISHRLEEIREIGDRVTILRDGERVHTGPVAGTDTSTIIQLMTGHKVDTGRLGAAKGGSRPYFVVEDLHVPRLDTRVSFSVREGEVLVITGLVGSGKSEIARAIFGSDIPNSGGVSLRGRRYRVRSPRDSIGRGIGYLPEDRDVDGLCLNMTIRDNVTLTYHGKYTGAFYARAEEKRVVEKYIEDLRIKCRDLDQEVQFLSGGNKQKVVLAKWLCARCEFLILDEPTIGIDVGARAEIYRLVRDFADEGHAVLFVTSDIDEALLVADRLLVVSNREIAGEFDAADTTKEAILGLCMSAGR